jgi:hypothetical protein
MTFSKNIMAELIIIDLKDKIVDFCGDKELFVFFEINGYNFTTRPFNFDLKLTAKDLPYTLDDLFKLNKKVEETYENIKKENKESVFNVHLLIFYNENIKIKIFKSFNI